MTGAWQRRIGGIIMPQAAEVTSRARLSPEEMRALAQLAADGAGLRDNTKSRIARVARVLSLSWRRASALWYGDIDHWIAAAEAARLRGERERLLRARVERLGREIAETERLIQEARQRHEAVVVADRRDAERACQLALPLGRRPA